MRIELETSDQAAGIRTLLVEAFPTPVEADLVERLRDGGHAEIGFAAIEGNRVVGYILLSRMSAPMKALGLGPVAVSAGKRRLGIGRSLIEAGLERARRAGWEAVFVLGEPDYYTRFGFAVDEAAGYETPYAGAYFMIASLTGNALPRHGRVDYAPPFADLA